ncbi:hypothetical protein [Thiomicrorhabdus sediminis]|uniref:Uncharacterized protein n=1 Tax=Thiomicrorhabdus sediminis TaxID=2580412 RepID=A0A4P9K722_9GAMM|nr:hypothetical protein [Thiomicrorhabdus sediminis]QCU90718.1 hypothetical protein FE785_08795 [Thiomicrorhabdus sediminis]
MKSKAIDYRDSEFYSPMFDTAYIDETARLPSEIVLFWLQDLLEKHDFSISAETWLAQPKIHPVDLLQAECSCLENALHSFRNMLNIVGSEAALDINYSSNSVVEFEFYRNPQIETPFASFAVGQWLVFSLLMRVIELYSDAKPACISFIGDQYFTDDINVLFSGCPVSLKQNKIALYYRNQDLNLSQHFFAKLSPNQPCSWELRRFIHEMAPSHFAAKRISGEALAHALAVDS